VSRSPKTPGSQLFSVTHLILPAVKISGAGTSQDTSHFVPPPSAYSSCSATDSSQASGIVSEISCENTISDTLSDIDESELGEFLMDTFEGIDASESTDMPELIT
jgi:hypothetical protein